MEEARLPGRLTWPLQGFVFVCGLCKEQTTGEEPGLAVLQLVGL